MQLGSDLKRQIDFLNGGIDSPKSLVIQDDLAAAVALELYKMDYCLELNQYQQKCPNLQDLKTHQALDARTLYLMLENQIQNF